MFSDEYGRRRVLAVLLLIFLSSSCCSSTDAWQFHHVKGISPYFCSQQVLFTRQSSLDVMEVEILNDRNGMRMYVNLFLCPLEPGKHKIVFKYGFPNLCQQEGEASILEGGQRLLIAQDTASDIISMLLEGEAVCLEIGPYQMTLLPSNFPVVWTKLSRQNLSQ